jgi:tetratricopeptide (TPR) repeat protein
MEVGTEMECKNTLVYVYLYSFIACALVYCYIFIIVHFRFYVLLTHLVKAYKIQSELLGPMHPEVAQTVQNLGILYKRKGNLLEARLYCDKALSIRTQVFDPRHPLVEASLHNLGSCCFSQGDLNKARGCFEQVLDIQTERLGGHQHPRAQQSLMILAQIAMKQGRMEDAKLISTKLDQTKIPK